MKKPLSIHFTLAGLAAGLAVAIGHILGYTTLISAVPHGNVLIGVVTGIATILTAFGVAVPGFKAQA